jgi:hypothetical protein
VRSWFQGGRIYAHVACPWQRHKEHQRAISISRERAPTIVCST